MTVEQEVEAMSRSELIYKYLELVKERDELKKYQDETWQRWQDDDITDNALDKNGVTLTEDELDRIRMKCQKAWNCEYGWEVIDQITDEVIEERT